MDADELVEEIPVYLSKSLSRNLYVLQYPVRPNSHTYDDDNIMKAKIKPALSQVELELGLHTKSGSYDTSKGEQIALNVDGPYRDKRDSAQNFYSSNIMDKLVLSSQQPSSDINKYCVGVMSDGALHLTPVSNIVALRPNFAYLDMAEKRTKKDKKGEDSDDSENEETARKVTVKFEKPETERSKYLREKSYSYIQKKQREEPWIDVAYHRYDSEKSKYDHNRMFCASDSDSSGRFNLEGKQYLNALLSCKSQNEDKSTSASLTSSSNLSKSALASLPLQDRLKTLMINARLATFSEVLNIVSNGIEDANSVLKSLQQVAVLVQGNWVVKSDLIFPKSIISGEAVSNEILQKLRDYILYEYTLECIVNRDDVLSKFHLNDINLAVVLKGVALKGEERGTWKLALPKDDAFIQLYPDVVQRQAMIWQSRIQQIFQRMT